MLGKCLPGDTLQEKILKVSKFHRYYILPLWLFFGLALVGISTYLSYLGGRKEHYSDVTKDWEACLFQPNYVTLPVQELVETSPIAPILKNLGISVTNKDLSIGNFVNALVYLCCQTITMTFLGQIVIFRSWNHIGWILPSAFFGLWCSLLAMTYYTASPPLPVASETTSTIILLSYWLKKSKFENINGGDNVCDSAYDFLVVVIILNVILIALLGICNTLAFSIEFLRLSDPQRVVIRSPKGSTLVLILTLVMMCCYVGEFLGRLVTSLNSLKALDNYNEKLEDIEYQPGDTSLKMYLPEIYYPFQPGYINLTSLCWAVVYISATRAYFGSRIAAYKTAAAASLLFFLTNSSSMFYVMSLYYDLDLWKDSVCFNYFQLPEYAALYLYPNDYQSKVYCQGTRISTFLAVALYVAMLVMFLLSSYLYYNYATDFDPEKGDTIIENGARLDDLGGEYYVFDDPGLPRNSSRDSKRSQTQSVKLLNTSSTS